MTKLKWQSTGRGYRKDEPWKYREEDAIDVRDLGFDLELKSGTKHCDCNIEWFKLYKMAQYTGFPHDLFYKFFQRNDTEGLKEKMYSTEYTSKKKLKRLKGMNMLEKKYW